MKITIAGYYGFGNVGDELILRALLQDLKTIKNPVQITVLSNNPDETEKTHFVSAVNRWSLRQAIRAILNCDVFVFGGGGLLQDVTSIGTLWYYLALLWAAIFFRKKVVVWRVGAGPVRSPVNRFFVKAALGRCHYVSVRDQSSKQELVSYGCKMNIEVLHDPVFDLQVGEKPSSAGGDSLPRFAFIVRSALTKSGQSAMIESLSKAASYFLKIYNAEIHLAVFQPGGDEALLDQLFSRLKEEVPFDALNKVHRYLPASPDDVLLFLRRQDLVVSARYHGVALSLMMHTPVLGLALDPKLRHLISEIFPSDGPDENLLKLDELNPEPLIAKIERIWLERENFKRRSIEAVRRLNHRKGALAQLITQDFPQAETRLEAPKSERTLADPAETALEKSRRFLTTHPFLFGLAIFLPFLTTALIALERDARNIFLSQKGGLVLEVFAKTDLRPEDAPLLEEALRMIPGVREVVATSPEEALNKIASDPNFSIDEEWLSEKANEVKGKRTLLPWSYDLHLERLDDATIQDVLARVQNIEAGVPKTAVVSEVHYDSERWALVSGLYNYLRWIRAVLWISGISVLIFAGFAFGKRLKRKPSRKLFVRSLRVSVLLGLFAGLICHALYIAVLSMFFFADRSNWHLNIGQYLIFQIAAASAVVAIGLATVSDSVRTGSYSVRS